MNLKNFLSIIKNSKNLPEPSVYYKILIEIKDIPEDVKERCYSKILKSSEWSYKLRRDKKEIPSDIKKKLELKACEDPQGAYLLRRDIRDLSKKIKKLSEFKACRDLHWGYYLGKDVEDISFLTKIKIKKNTKMETIRLFPLEWPYLYPFWVEISNWNIFYVSNLQDMFKISFNHDISSWTYDDVTIKLVEKEEKFI